MGGRRGRVGALASVRGLPCALTVAHLFVRRGSVTARFAGPGQRGRLLIWAPLQERCSHPFDLAAVALAPGTSYRPLHPLLGAPGGPLAAFAPGREVVALGCGEPYRGRIVHPSWSGTVRYRWGRRRLRDQLVIAVDGDRAPPRGESGMLWATADGLAAGLQVARIGGCAIVSPLAGFLGLCGGRLLPDTGRVGTA